MNRIKKVMNPKLIKKLKKEVRSSRTGKATNTAETDAKLLLAKYPMRTVKKNESLYISTIKNIEAKKAKSKSKTSKRTTPGTVEERSPRASSHPEGKQWIKTLQKQTKEKRVLFQKKATKNRF